MQNIVSTVTMNCLSCLLPELFPTRATLAAGEESSVRFLQRGAIRGSGNEVKDVAKNIIQGVVFA